MARRPEPQELVVIAKTYDFIVWTCQHTTKFPRNHRFALGGRIERNLYALLETFHWTKFGRELGIKAGILAMIRAAA